MTQFFSGKKVLITGGLGFIGSNLARTLVNLGAEVTLLDNLTAEGGGNLFNIRGLEDKLRNHLGDARDVHLMRELVKNQEYLFNLAGQSSHLDSMLDPFADMNVNCQVPLAALEACRLENPSIRIVFASTRQVYGRPNYLPVDENHPVNPVDVNGIHKLTGELYHQLYHQVYGLRTVILRLTNTIGPRMRIKDVRQTFLGVWIRCIMEKRPFEVWHGAQRRDFTYVDDAVSALLLAASKNAAIGQTMNLGGDCVISLESLAERLKKLHGGARFQITPFPKERKDIDIGDYFADDQKCRQLLGWEPKIALSEGLKRTLVFYKKHWMEYV